MREIGRTKKVMILAKFAAAIMLQEVRSQTYIHAKMTSYPKYRVPSLSITLSNATAPITPLLVALLSVMALYMVKRKTSMSKTNSTIQVMPKRIALSPKRMKYRTVMRCVELTRLWSLELRSQCTRVVALAQACPGYQLLPNTAHGNEIVHKGKWRGTYTSST